ncbi:hypothetical protein [Chitinimonas lacunae]|uniref:Beta-propeller fold lactonase family protein n=1 Tax=Chitinimonas lacunae TaxID=1963018 RepID=A0ABV8MU59_9NEIS
MKLSAVSIALSTLMLGGFSASVLAADLPVLKPVNTFAAPLNINQMVYAPGAQLMFARQGDKTIVVLDTFTQAQISQKKMEESVVDLSLSPSGRYLFASEFGGQSVYGNPIRPSRFHRFDVRNRSWSTKNTAQVAYRVEAVGDDRFLALDQDQWVSLALMQWNGNEPTVKSVSRTGTSLYAGDIGYSHQTGLIAHSSAGMSPPELNVFKLEADGVVSKEKSEFLYYVSGTPIVSTDGSQVYFSGTQTHINNIRTKLREFPEVIIAATAKYAISRQKLYSAVTGEPVATLSGAVTALAINPNGSDFWVYNEGAATLSRYLLPSSVAFDVSTNELTKAGEVVVNWLAEEGASCSASGAKDWDGPVGRLGRKTVSIAVSSTLKIQCTVGQQVQESQARIVVRSQPDCLLDWAQTTYPKLFPTAPAGTGHYAPYTFRHYPANDQYLGVSSADSSVYLVTAAPERHFLNVGPLQDWLRTASCPLN